MRSPVGVILAGGLSRRMEGPEKTLLNLEGKTLIEHVRDKLKLQVDTIILNANGDPERFLNLGLAIQSDTLEGYAGPLAGVLAGMKWTKKHSSSKWIVTAAGDTPFFPDDYVKTMIAKARDTNAHIALASSGGRKHPVFGLWPVDLADELEDFLVKENNRKVMLFVERYNHVLVEFENQTAEHDPFFNVNTPNDMEEAQKIVSRLQTS